MTVSTANSLSAHLSHALRAQRLYSTARHWLLGISLICLTACKVTIIVPAGGRVVSDNGIVCLTGQQCTINVTDTTFDDTFHAEPDPGYVFLRWEQKQGYFCGNKTSPCHLFTTTFGDNQALLEWLDRDTVFYLEPVFENNSGYNASYWATTVEEIQAGSHSTNSYLYSIAPNVEQCEPGALKDAPRNRALKALNEVRALGRLPAVDYDSFYDMQVQEASLVQRANNYLRHFPDPGDACYSASAEEGAATSNLTLGPQADPAAHIFGWANDSQNAAAVMAAGHRRWVMFPGLGYLAYGQVDGAGTQKVFSFGLQPGSSVPPGVEYVAFPYKTYPYVLVSRGDNLTPWSISMVPPAGQSSRFDYFSDATVTVENAETGSALTVTNKYTDTQGFGLANFLSWIVENWEYDTIYNVTISGVKMPGGDTRNISYQVLLDRYNLVNLAEPLEAGDSQSGGKLQGMFNTTADRDSYTDALSGMRSFNGQSEFSNQAFYIMVYDDRKRLLKSSDTAFSMNFPEGTYTIVVSPCDDEGLCYQSVKNYTVTY